MPKAINVDEGEMTARDFALILNAIIGKSGIYNFGNKLSHTVVSSNKIRLKDGIMCIQGRHYIVYPNETIDLTIENGSQGMKRNDFIVLEYSKNEDVETIQFKVIKGTPNETKATDPEITQDDTLSSGSVYQEILYRVRLDGINIEGVDDLRMILPRLNKCLEQTNEGDGYIVVNYDK